MCRACLTAHLDQVVTGLQAQLSSKIGCLEFRVDPCQMCSPTAVAKPVVRPCARVFRFPGSLPRCRSFARTLRVIGIVLGNLKANKVVTSRDIYYQDVVLFGNQRNVVSAIASLTRLLGVPRESLGVMPSPNGLLAGDMTIALEDGDIVETRRRNGATLIPVQPILYVTAAKPPEFILVVEKEAVFSYLQWELPEAIVVTGRGFPDRATSNMVRALSLSYPEVPIYGLVDSDPHGILICRNYERGSRIAAHGRGADPRGGPVPRRRAARVHGRARAVHADRPAARREHFEKRLGAPAGEHGLQNRAAARPVYGFEERDELDGPGPGPQTIAVRARQSPARAETAAAIRAPAGSRAA